LNNILDLIEQKISEYLYNNNNSILIEAMRYTTLGGGKRIRPLLTIATGNINNAKIDDLIDIGVAVEFIHCYSLIHDDLPAMDNDELRRGKPTCHKKYNEAIAILTGDALYAEAFNIISSPNKLGNISPLTRIKMIQELSSASGKDGMVGGQVIDIMSTGQILTLEQLQEMHLQKTAKLIKSAMLCGYLAGQQYEQDAMQILTQIGLNLGLIFQITDDILDITSDENTLGKTAKKDLIYNKATYVNILGLEQSQNRRLALYKKTLELISKLNADTNSLVALTNTIYKRHN
jgi:geranylgeranyl pyrophosphate synthase